MLCAGRRTDRLYRFLRRPGIRCRPYTSGGHTSRPGPSTAMSARTTCEWASCVRISLDVRLFPACSFTAALPSGFADPVTAVVPSQDNQTYLATTIDGHVRLMDMSTGKMLNDFTGHASSSYRIRACFGHGEASVVCGDEDGKVWAWDLVDVRAFIIFSPF